MFTVYIDMDGVVCDWYGVEGTRTFSKEWFHSFIDDNGFCNLAPLGRLDLLKGLIQDLKHEASFVFLSSAGGVPEEYASKVTKQKRYWLDNNGFEDVMLICVKHKGKKKDFASPNSILIDDTESNCSDFIEHNGHAVKTNSLVGFQEEHISDVLLAASKILLMYADQYYK